MPKKKMNLTVPLIAVGALGAVGATFLLSKKTSAQPAPSPSPQPSSGNLLLTVDRTNVDIFSNPNPVFTITNNTLSTLEVDFYRNGYLQTTKVVSSLSPTLSYTFTVYSNGPLNTSPSYYAIGYVQGHRNDMPSITSNTVYVSYWASR